MLFHPALLVSLLALPTTLLATTTTTTTSTPPHPTLQTATLYAHPAVSPTPSAPSTLAILTYAPTHPHLSTLKSFTPPANTSDPDALTGVLVYLDGQAGGDGYRSTVTATYGFHAPYKGRFRVLLDGEGVVVGASWHSYLPRGPAVAGKGKGKGKVESVENGRGDFSILTTKPAPSVVFDKVAKGTAGATGAGTGAGMGGQEGEGEVVEKTFLQKYWWVLLGVAVLAMTGGGDK